MQEDVSFHNILLQSGESIHEFMVSSSTDIPKCMHIYERKCLRFYLLGIPICVTRTVELPSTQTIGIERSKLLFMIAIGLDPNIGRYKHPVQICSIEITHNIKQ